MKALNEMTPDEGVTTAVTILLEQGWNSEYYTDWRDYAEGEYGEEIEDYDILEISSVWEALMSYTNKSAEFEGLRAEFVATQGNGLAHDSEVYFVVLSLTDLTTGKTRYFKRDGWYASYDGGHLEEGENREVFPQEKTVTVYEESK